MFKSCAWAFKDGEKYGYVVVNDYKTETGARKAAERLMTTDVFDAIAIEVREYPDREMSCLFAVPAGTNPDNGKEVYRDVTTLQGAIDKRFHDLRRLYPDDFEGTMSYMIDMIQGGEFEEEKFLEPILGFLRDDEVNALLEEHGDNEYFTYKDGRLEEADVELDKE